MGTAATSVLGDLAVVFGMDVPAQGYGEEHPQKLSREKARVRVRLGCPGPQRPQVNTRDLTWMKLILN